jgi:hypothetical protein
MGGRAGSGRGSGNSLSDPGLVLLGCAMDKNQKNDYYGFRVYSLGSFEFPLAFLALDLTQVSNFPQVLSD